MIFTVCISALLNFKYFYVSASFTGSGISLILQIYDAVHKCICSQARNCREVLAYRTQFGDIFSGTHACDCSGNLFSEEALSRINLSLTSSSSHASV